MEGNRFSLTEGFARSLLPAVPLHLVLSSTPRQADRYPLHTSFGVISSTRSSYVLSSVCFIVFLPRHKPTTCYLIQRPSRLVHVRSYPSFKLPRTVLRFLVHIKPNI